jgi:hypothetical protein
MPVSRRADASASLLPTGASSWPGWRPTARLEAVTSGRIVPSNYWRTREVISAVAERGPPEAADLAEAYREACGDGERPALP